jgi:hypothetical protein
MGRAIYDAVLSLVFFVAALSVVPLLFKLFVPGIGPAVWRGYWRLLGWVVVAPFRLVRELWNHRR